MILRIGSSAVYAFVQMELLKGYKVNRSGQYIIEIKSVRELVDVLDREDFNHPVIEHIPDKILERMLNHLPDIKANLAECESWLNGAPD